MNAMKTKSFIVGIAGGTGSGKTTIAAGIAAAIGAERATLIDADSYYADLSHLPLQERHYENFDHPNALNLALLAQHLRNLRSGKPVNRHVYHMTIPIPITPLKPIYNLKNQSSREGSA